MESTKRNNFFTITLLIISMLGFSITTYASGKNVAKVIILKGKVKAKSNNKVINLKKGMWLTEGAMIQSAPRSFCKLLFVDKSQMSLGPKSKMEIKAFPKNKPGIINLLNGQLRSKVTKNYMKMGDKNKSKLFIKTRSAAMGVRGTDFQVNFNQENMVTSLVTFEGAVAMARLDDQVAQINQNVLEKIVSSKDAVIVVKGQYSGVDQASPRATAPTKISPNQLNTLKNTTDNTKQLNTSRVKVPKKQFRSPIPPGVSAKTFATSSKSLEKSVAAVAGTKIIVQVKQEVAKQDRQEPKWAAVKKNQAVVINAPKAGGFVDLKTALYVAPPKGSAFDANAGVFIPPANVGSIDPKTGDYQAPAGYALTAKGTYETKPMDIEPGRTIASVGRPTVDGKAPLPGIEGQAMLPPPPPVTMPSEDPVFVDEPTFDDQQTVVDTSGLIDNVLEDFDNAPPPVETEGFTNAHIHIQ